jgi:hypothetical protein
MLALGLLVAAAAVPPAPRARARERVCTFTAPSGDSYDISGLSQPGTEYVIEANTTTPGEAFTFFWNGCDGTLNHPSDGDYPDEPGCLGPESDDQDGACQHGPRELDPHAHWYSLGKLAQVRFAEERPGFLAIDYQRSGFNGRSLTVEITCDRDAAEPLFELNMPTGGDGANSVLRVRSVHGCVVGTPPAPPPPPPAPGAKCFRIGPPGLPRNLRIDAVLSFTSARDTAPEPVPARASGSFNSAGQWLSTFGYEGATGQWFVRGVGTAVVSDFPGKTLPDFPSNMYISGEVNRTFNMFGNTTDAEGRPVVSYCSSEAGDRSLRFDGRGQFTSEVGAIAFEFLFDGPGRSRCVGEGTDFPRGANRTIAAQSFPVFASTADTGCDAEYVLFEEQMGEDGPEDIPVSYRDSVTTTSQAPGGAPLEDFTAFQIQYSNWTPHMKIPPEEWEIPGACYEDPAQRSGWNEKALHRPVWRTPPTPRSRTRPRRG